MLHVYVKNKKNVGKYIIIGFMKQIYRDASIGEALLSHLIAFICRLGFSDRLYEQTPSAD